MRILIGRLLSIYLYIRTASSVTTGSETLHHKYRDDDQYYPLGETSGYIISEQVEAYAVGMRSHEQAHIKALSDLSK